MDDKHRDILRRHWSSFRRDLEPVKLLPYLVDVLDATDDQGMKVKATREEQTDKLLDILPRRGPKASDDFVKTLREVQPFLGTPLLQKVDIFHYSVWCFCFNSLNNFLYDRKTPASLQALFEQE